MPHKLPKTLPLGSEPVFQVALSNYVSIFLLHAAYSKFLASPYVGFVKYIKKSASERSKSFFVFSPLLSQAHLLLFLSLSISAILLRVQLPPQQLSPTTTVKACLPLPFTLHPPPQPHARDLSHCGTFAVSYLC